MTNPPTVPRVPAITSLFLLCLIFSFYPVAAQGGAPSANGASPLSAPLIAAPLDLSRSDVRSLAVHPRDPDLVAAGTAGGRVALSRDGGRTWAAAGSGTPFHGWVVGTLRFDPLRSHRLWAGAWGVWGSGMVAVSDDLGATWNRRQGDLPPEPVYDLVAVEEGDTTVLYAGLLSGVWRSGDGGATWRHLTAGNPEIHHVSSLWVGSGSHGDGTLIAGTWRRAYRSDDGGASWQGIFAGMELDSEVFRLRSRPGSPGELWAATCGWLYRSPDLGGRWVRFKEGLPERRTPALEVLGDGRVLAGTIAGLYVSADGGASWQRRTAAELVVRAISFDPRRPGRILLATEGRGVWRSDDGGRRFEPSSRPAGAAHVLAPLAAR